MQNMLPHNSPWGAVQHCEVMSKGVYLVDTASHGGIMIEAKYAKEILSPEAQKIGFKEKGYINFEEDCDADIAIRELIDNNIWEIPDRIKNKEEFENNINNSIKYYYPEYWQSRENRLLNIDNNKRYIVYDFLIGNPVLIDIKEKTLNIYGSNMYGQIYNLENPKSHKITARTVNGLIKRSNNIDYSFKTAKATDYYIYEHFMTREQQKQCYLIKYIDSKKIVSTNDFKEAVRKICEMVYEKNCLVYKGSEKENKKQDTLKYCENYLNCIDKTKINSNDDRRKSVIQTLNKNKSDVKPPELANRAKYEKNQQR